MSSSPFFLPVCCTVSPCLSFSPWLCSCVSRRKGAQQGEGSGPVVADVWLLGRKRAMREYGNVCIAWHDACLAWPVLHCTQSQPFFMCKMGEGWKKARGGGWVDGGLRSNSRKALWGGCFKGGLRGRGVDNDSDEWLIILHDLNKLYPFHNLWFWHFIDIYGTFLQF